MKPWLLNGCTLSPELYLGLRAQTLSWAQLHAQPSASSTLVPNLDPMPLPGTYATCILASCSSMEESLPITVFSMFSILTSMFFCSSAMFFCSSAE